MLYRPLVCIVTTTLDAEKYLAECMSSVLSQSYSNVKHVIVDGGSKDKTLDIAKRYQEKYENKVMILQGVDRGPGDAWNKGIKASPEKSIMGWLGADDTYPTDAIQTVVDFFDKNRRENFVYGKCNYIDAYGLVIGQCEPMDFDIKVILDRHNMIPCSSAFFKREVFDWIGSFDDLGNDRDYWIRCSRLYRMNRIDAVLSNFRIHKDSRSCDNGLRVKWLGIACKTSRKHGASLLCGYCRAYYKGILSSGLKSLAGVGNG